VQRRNTDPDPIGRDLAAKLFERIRGATPRLADRAQVTVIIPAWLRDAQDLVWLEEALDSVLAQTMPCKAVIVENGSRYFADLSGRVSVIHSDQGLSAARNAGIRYSDTEFFFPLDCNDWLPEDALEILLKKYPGQGFVYGSTMLFRNERGEGDQHLYEAQPYDFQEVMKMVYFPNGALQRKADWETVGGYREDLPFLEDWDYWLTAGERGICGTAIPETTYWYRQHAGIVVTHKHSPQWEEVKRRIQALHRDIYKGRYPEMCCGNKENRVPFVAPVQAALAPGADGMQLIEYVGGNAGTMTFYGPITGTRYKAGGVILKLYVDVRDAITGSKKQPGFLEMQDHGNAIFRAVVEEPEPA
jgi:glycosyltransferase involved in cell wall biosynthesis